MSSDPKDVGQPVAEVAWGPKGDMFFLPLRSGRRVPVTCATAGTIDPSSDVVVFGVENEGSGDGDGGPDGA